MGGPLSRRSLCLFWRETKLRPELEISTRREVGTGTPESGVGKRNSEKAVGEGWRRGQSRPDSRRDQSAWNRVQEQWGRTSQDESAFLVACGNFAKKTLHISDSLQMHKEMQCHKLALLALELTQAHIVRLFLVLFLPLPWLYFLCRKELCDTPVGATRWSPAKIEMV